MQIVIGSLGALAIANIYYWYRSYRQAMIERQCRLCERVAYMLWVAAQHVA